VKNRWVLLVPFLLQPAMADMSGMPMNMDMSHGMQGMYGPYSMDREASGTSWQPDSTPHQAIDLVHGDWMYMVHGFANLGYTNQGGPEGSSQVMTTNMGMFMAQRPFETGSVGFRGMMSLEPLMGSNGYPELLQTGETANGQFPLLNRQHPHDLFMELAVTGNRQITNDVSVFAYGGLPGEPALGPTTFMHRLSGEDNPEAPIGHHWMDSTHVTYGVLTGGLVWKNVKLEASAFRGREPDQYHWDIEQPKLDSSSGRLSWNPGRDWSLQTSAGRLHSPEQLFSTINTNRVTASIVYTRAWADGWSSTTAGWGRDYQLTIDTLDAWLLESAVNFDNAHTFFTRYENVQKDDLLSIQQVQSLLGNTSLAGFRVEDGHPFFVNGHPVLHIFDVNRFTLGYIYDFLVGEHTRWGIGASGSAIFVPAALKPFVGNNPLSFLVFVRVKLGSNHVNNQGIHPIPSGGTPFEKI